MTSILYGPSAEDDITWTVVVWDLAALFPMIAAQTLGQFGFMRAFGARPRFGSRLRFGVTLVTAWRVEGHKFTRKQFAVVGSIPVLLAAAVGTIYIIFTPAAEWGVWMLAVYLLAAWRFLWLSALAALQPRGALFEEHREGTLIHEPLRQGGQEIL